MSVSTRMASWAPPALPRFRLRPMIRWASAMSLRSISTSVWAWIRSRAICSGVSSKHCSGEIYTGSLLTDLRCSGKFLDYCSGCSLSSTAVLGCHCAPLSSGRMTNTNISLGRNLLRPTLERGAQEMLTICSRSGHWKCEWPTVMYGRQRILSNWTEWCCVAMDGCRGDAASLEKSGASRPEEMFRKLRLGT